jgi:hypothetical protein
LKVETFLFNQKQKNGGVLARRFSNFCETSSAHFAAVDGVVAEFLFDAEELVVFGDAVGSAE